MFRPSKNTSHLQTKTAKVNEKIARINQSTDVEDIRSLTNFDKILCDNPFRDHIKGFYVEIPLSEYKTYVPNGVNFPDRDGKHYSSGPFDAPLLTLKEWRDSWEKAHPNTPKPDLLVNANWFNVWQSGTPNQGEKFNPRIQQRTYLAGLSLSDGNLVSTHKVLDQNNVGLDVITFDTKTNKAATIPFNKIDEEIANHQDFYDNKNAVSGFIILNNNVKQKSPDINNNHPNRLPRTGVGFKKDGKNVVVMVIYNRDRRCGVTADEFANLFASLGCTDAINLDNSGSVELYYHGLSKFGKTTTTVNSQTCDMETSQRPKPNFLGFKSASKCKLFANDDSDMPAKKMTTVNTTEKDKKSKVAKTDDDMTYRYYLNK